MMMTTAGRRPATDVSGLKVLVLGLGKSGVSTAGFFSRFGAEVTATDRKERPLSAETMDTLIGTGVRLLLGAEPAEIPAGIDVILPSPGVSVHHPLLVEAARRGVAVWGELESAWRLFPHRRTIAVTGTNGKTTVTELTAHLLKAAGVTAWTGGNIGTPMIEVLSRVAEDDWVVAEVSSFQISLAPSFAPLASAFLNFDEDHLDWHASMDEYFRAKAAMVRQTLPDGLVILPVDDERIRALSGVTAADPILFGGGPDVVYSGPETLVVAEATAAGSLTVHHTDHGIESTYVVEGSALRGRHNLENAAAALALASVSGVPISDLCAGLAGYEPGAHRLQAFAEHGGVRYVDDSKATNPLAVRAAVDSFSAPIILLAGGRNKGYDLAGLSKWASVRVKALVCFGESGAELAEASKAPMTARADSMGEAVALAMSLAAAGDVVLLSPGCASFDEFIGYAQRGEAFQAEVTRIATEGAA